MIRKRSFEMGCDYPNNSSESQHTGLRFPSRGYTVEVVDLDTDAVIRTHTDHTGYHVGGALSETGDSVIYITVDRHWWFPPLVSIWDLGSNTVKTKDTEHHIQTAWMDVAYHFGSGNVVLGGVDGLSAHNMKTETTVWHKVGELGPGRLVQAVALSSQGNLICALGESKVSVLSFNTGKCLVQLNLFRDYCDCGFQDNDRAIYLQHSKESKPRKIIDLDQFM